MGMNIYTLKGKHIGKRYAAGIWCWDCRKELVEGALFCCEKAREFFQQEEPLKNMMYNPAMRELGFDKSIPKKHRGVDGASGWIWCIGEYGLGDTVQEVKKILKRYRFVKTEYGEKWDISKFWDMFKDIIVEQTSDADFC